MLCIFSATQLALRTSAEMMWGWKRHSSKEAAASEKNNESAPPQQHYKWQNKSETDVKSGFSKVYKIGTNHWFCKISWDFTKPKRQPVTWRKGAAKDRAIYGIAQQGLELSGSFVAMSTNTAVRPDVRSCIYTIQGNTIDIMSRTCICNAKYKMFY